MNYTINRNGQKYGPYSREDLRRYLIHGSVLETDLVSSEDQQRWVTVRELHLTPPLVPGGNLSVPYGESAMPARRVNKVALICVIVLWLAAFFAPLLTVGWGPIELANATLWDCLGLASSGVIKFAALLALSAPIPALLLRSRVANVLYLAPASFLGGLALLVAAGLNQLEQTINTTTQDSPLLAALSQAGMHAAAHSVSLAFGAYVLAFTSILLGFQILAER